jgi:5-methyltetrahydrofolate--homocysteine methyltransferase
MSPKDIAGALAEFVGKYKHVRMVGGCCGTNPQHIAELRKALDRSSAR